MQRAIIVRGRLSDSLHIELDEPVSEITGEVEVLIRRSEPKDSQDEDMDLVDLLQKLGPGTRSKEDIDRQLQEDRDSSRER